MASIARSKVSVRFFGDELEPEEVSAMLGAEPTTQYRKGEERKSTGGKTDTRRFGAWILASGERSPEAIDDQLAELFKTMSQDMSVWSALVSRFDADVFCGLFMAESNEGFSLKPHTLRALADRRLEIGFDIYDPDEEDDPASGTPPSQA